MHQPRRPKHQKGRKTRQALIDAGIDLVSRRGYRDTRADDIAQHAGYSVGTFYAYFKDKADVMLAIQEDLEEETRLRFTSLPDEAQEEAPLDSVFTETFRRSLDLHRSRRNIYKELENLAVHDSRIRKGLERVNENLVKTLADLLHRFLPELSKDRRTTLARMLFGSSTGLIHQVVLDEKGDEDVLAAYLSMATDFLEKQHIQDDCQ